MTFAGTSGTKKIALLHNKIYFKDRHVSNTFKVQNTNSFMYFKYISSILVKASTCKRSFFPPPFPD